jgi:hypothetical protein
MQVGKSYASCNKFLVLEDETRITCIAMQVLDMAELSDIPTMDIPPRDDAPDIIKKIYLGRVSNIIYENYVSEHRNSTQIMTAVLAEQDVDALRNSQQVDENGRYPCTHMIKHFPTMENEEGITMFHILLLLRFLHKQRHV